VVIVRP